MLPIRKILLAVKDPISGSSTALRKSVQLARALQADLELFHSVATPVYVDAYPAGQSAIRAERSIRNEFRDALEVMAAPLRRTGLTVTTCVEWDYPNWEAIVRRAVKSKADLVLADRHLGRHVAPGLLQLTDWELLRSSPVPVLLIKTGGVYRHPVVLAAIDPAHAHAKPVQLDQRILGMGANISAALRGRLHAVHAYLPLPVGSFPEYSLSADLVARITSQTMSAARHSFEEALRSSGIARSRRHLLARQPGHAVEETARKTRAAIVVMGAVSRSGLKRLLIGNTAERLLDRLTCDLLILKPPRFTANVPRGRRGVRLTTTAALPGM